MPSPVYQWRKALRRNMPVNCSATRLNISWIAVVLPTKHTAIFNPFGGMSQMPHFMLFGIHSMKYDEFLFCTLSICSSTSFDDMRPRKRPAAVTRIRGTHHVLGIEHLLRELRHRQRAVLLRAARRQRREAVHEEMQAWKRDHVRAKLAQIAVELARETDGARDARQARGHEMVEVAVCRGRQLQRSEAYVIQCFVVEAEREVRILHQLVDGERAIIRFHDCVTYLRRRNDRVRAHHAVRVLLPDLRYEKSAHASAGATAKGVCHLKSLEAIATLGLLTDHIQHGIDELGALSVVPLGPVISCARLSEDEIVGTEELAERTGTHRIHGSRLKVHQDGAGHVATPGGLVVVDVDALQLQIRVSVVRPGRIDAVLVADHLPELRTDLVAALAALDVNELTHSNNCDSSSLSQ